jgi:hypothetical protein
MMGLGAPGPLAWLLGALAMIAIWGGVWWGLSTLVFHWPARERTVSATPRKRLSQQESRRWQQPGFDPGAPGLETERPDPQGSPQPHPRDLHQRRTNTESDIR